MACATPTATCAAPIAPAQPGVSPKSSSIAAVPSFRGGGCLRTGISGSDLGVTDFVQILACAWPSERQEPVVEGDSSVPLPIQPNGTLGHWKASVIYRIYAIVSIMAQISLRKRNIHLRSAYTSV